MEGTRAFGGGKEGGRKSGRGGLLLMRRLVGSSLHDSSVAKDAVCMCGVVGRKAVGRDERKSESWEGIGRGTGELAGRRGTV